MKVRLLGLQGNGRHKRNSACDQDRAIGNGKTSTTKACPNYRYWIPDHKVIRVKAVIADQ